MEWQFGLDSTSFGANALKNVHLVADRTKKNHIDKRKKGRSKRPFLSFMGVCFRAGLWLYLPHSAQ